MITFKVRNPKKEYLFTSVGVDLEYTIKYYIETYLLGQNIEDFDMNITEADIVEFEGIKKSTKLKNIPYIQNFLEDGKNRNIPITRYIITCKPLD